MKKQRIKSETPIHNAILIALHKRHGNAQVAHKSRNKKRTNRNSWRKDWGV